MKCREKAWNYHENALGSPFFNWENYICSQKKGDQSAINRDCVNSDKSRFVIWNYKKKTFLYLEKS
jgi:hypothetical protein